MEGEVVRADSDQHTHPTNVDQLVAEDIERSVINNNCENSTNRAIIAKIKERCNDESVSDNMSNIRNLTQRAQRKRTEVKSEGPRIRTFADLDLLPTEYTEFLVHCEENVFIFMEKKRIRNSEQMSNLVHGWDTFKMSHTICSNLCDRRNFQQKNVSLCVLFVTQS